PLCCVFAERQTAVADVAVFIGRASHRSWRLVQHHVAHDVVAVLTFLRHAKRTALDAVRRVFVEVVTYRIRIKLLTLGVRFGRRRVGVAAPERTELVRWSALGQRIRTTRQALKAGLADRKSTRLNSSHVKISYAVFCLKKKMAIILEVNIRYRTGLH